MWKINWVNCSLWKSYVSGEKCGKLNVCELVKFWVVFFWFWFVDKEENICLDFK